MFGLDSDTLRNIKASFSKFPQIEKVILYGSRAKGNYRNGSDIDITLVGKNLTLKNSVYPLMDELDEFDLPYTFDISIFENIDNDDLIEHILRVGKVFYAKESKLPEGWEIKRWDVDTAFGLIAGENLDKRYLYYFYQSLVKKDLIKIQIPLPPLPEQQHIVSILDKTFTTIAKAKANAKKNLKNASELFESYLQGVFENIKSYGFSIKNTKLYKLNEQKQIVQKLDAFLAETKKLEAIYQQKIEYLEELKKSILHKAFNGELT